MTTITSGGKALRSAIAVVALGLPIGGRAEAQVYQKIALSGEQAPGLPEGVLFSRFQATPFIAKTGEVVFNGLLVQGQGGVTSANDEGVWYGHVGDISVVARKGDPAAGGSSPGETYSFSPFASLFPIAIPSSNQLSFTGSIGSDRAVWVGPPDALTIASREGDQPPGITEPATFESFNGIPSLHPSGTYAFGGSFHVDRGIGGFPDRKPGLWVNRGSGLELVAAGGEEAPGTGGAVFAVDSVNTFTTAEFFGPLMNESGTVLFSGRLERGVADVTSQNNMGLWLGDASGVTLVAREGDPAPGLGGAVFDDQSDFIIGQINDSGDVLFRGPLRSGVGGVTSDSNEALWVGPPDNLQLLARGSMAAPGTEDMLTFTRFSAGGHFLAGNGEVAFLAGFEDEAGAPGTGIWRGQPDSLDLVLRTGEAAPGTPDGVVFDALRVSGTNGNGEIAFSAIVDGPGISDDNDFGIWAEGSLGMLHLIVREGDQIDVGSGDLRTVQSINSFFSAGSGFIAYGDESGLPSQFNSLGQVVFHAEFTDGSQGIFVVTVPEPSALALLALGGAILLSAAWRRRRIAFRDA